jgi:hypothetical protein
MELKLKKMALKQKCRTSKDMMKNAVYLHRQTVFDLKNGEHVAFQHSKTNHIFFQLLINEKKMIR